MSQTAANLLEELRRLHLLDQDQCAALGGLGGDAREMAREAVQRGWLTPWQANRIMEGHSAHLLLGSYILLEKLGEGGMGSVFKARNWKLSRLVALKVIRKERLDSDTMIRRFRREIEAAAQLSHPNIVHAFDADEVAGTHFFVMEFVEGRDLAKVVAERGKLPVAEACEYIRQAALGLQHAYERGLVHRDIKPSNLLVVGSGQCAVGSKGLILPLPTAHCPLPTVKLLDMGLARFERVANEHSSTLTQQGVIMGTPDYIAPEQARDSHSAEIRADLYSLGCTLYFLLTSNVPFPGGTLTEKLLKHQMDAPTPLRLLRADAPEDVARLVAKLMAKRPGERYQTPAELAAALDAILASGGDRSGSRQTSDASAGTLTSSATRLENPFANIDLPDSSPTVAVETWPGRSKTSSHRRWPLIAASAAAVLLSATVVIGLLLPSPKASDAMVDNATAKKSDAPKPQKLSPKEMEVQEA